MIDEKTKSDYLAILGEELLLATGCTEPIAVAYTAARLREVLGAKPEKILAEVSGNILKNVKSVVVPNTGGRRGIEAAIAVGVIAGDPEAGLQVIANVTDDDVNEIEKYIEETDIKVTSPETPRMLDIKLTGWAEGHEAIVHVANNHTNIVYVEKDGEVLLEKPLTSDPEDNLTDKSCLNLNDIIEFTETIPLEDIEDLIKRQIDCNLAISETGLNGNWGSNIGSLMLAAGSGIDMEVRAWAAAGSDARMNGCEMPVVICSGSGNQGITASVPVVKYGRHLGADEEKIIRAVCLSDLVTLHQKALIGRLSAYCGAISAGIGAGCAIAWLKGADYDGIAHTLMNAAAMLSGCICDGAKASCASKISMAVESGILGYNMHLTGNDFRSGDGIVGEDVEETVRNVGELASEGMRETDRVILKIMTEE